jgi:uncharacterized protein (TIGR01244 family)
MIEKPITPEISIADQPTEAELKALKPAGYVGVVNLRNDGEPEQPLGTAAEGGEVRALGMDYLHVGVGGAPLTEQGVRSVSEFLDRHEGQGKVLVHCRKGSRAAALVLLHFAVKEGWPASEAISRGEEIDLRVDGKLREMVEAYLIGRNVS